MRQQPKNWKKSGETIVEVLMCAVIFLLLMAVLEAAVLFASKAQNKSRVMQTFYDREFSKLTGTGIGGTESSYSFSGTDGASGSFTVDVKLQEEIVTGTDSDGNSHTVRFPVFGGDTP